MVKKITLSGLHFDKFDTTIEGKRVQLYALTNANGCELTICNYGARIISLLVPDKDGNMVDVVTGHDSIEAVLEATDRCFGVVCGRYANSRWPLRVGRHRI